MDAREVRLANHVESASRLIWSADGALLAVDGNADRVMVYTKDGELLRTLRTNDVSAQAFALTSDFRYLLDLPDPNIDADNSIAFVVRNAITGRLVHLVPGPEPSGKSEQNRSKLIAISANGKVAGSVALQNRDVPIQLYDAQSWAAIGQLISPGPNYTMSLAFSNDGSHVARGNLRGSVSVFDTFTQREVISFQAYQAPGFGVGVQTLAFSPDGASLATGPYQGQRDNPPIPVSARKMVEVWRVADGSRMRTLDGVDGPVRGLSWSPDGRFLAGTSSAGTHIWSASRGGPPCVSSAFSPDHADAVAFSPDGATLAVGGMGSIFLFKMKNN